MLLYRNASEVRIPTVRPELVEGDGWDAQGGRNAKLFLTSGSEL
jgi:hypothetical protein